MRVLFVPVGTERIAASRYRVYQYGPALERERVEYDVFPALSDFTTALMLASPTFGAAKKRLYYAWVLAERLARFLPVLAKAGRYDVVFLQRATFFGLEGLLRRRCDRLVFDFDDAIFMADPSDGEGSTLGRLKSRLKSFEVTRALRACRIAIVENQYLKRYAEEQGARVAIIPGPIDTDHFVPARRTQGGPITLGWIGSPSTTPYLAELRPVLARLGRQFDVRFKTIGAGNFSAPGIETLNAPWSLQTELADLQSFDIGVMPMPNDAWSLGKLGCKMLLYMSCGLPAVVSYTATNAEVIEDGVNGFLVRDADAWYERLAELVRDAPLRQRMGEAARRTAERDFSLRAGAGKLVELLAAVATGA